jgi:hypothetical protein
MYPLLKIYYVLNTINLHKLRMSYTYTPRLVWDFDTYLATTKYKSFNEILKLRQQWDTFENVENYDDKIYKQIVVDRNYSQTFYTFNNPLNNVIYTQTDYYAGQQLHILANPQVPCSTFNPIRNRPLPAPPTGTILPGESQVCKRINPPPPISAEQLAKNQGDQAIYAYVSTYNGTHKYKYAFTTMDEKLSYYNGEKLILGLP